MLCGRRDANKPSTTRHSYLRGEAGLWWLQVLLGELCVSVRVAALLALQLCSKTTVGQQSGNSQATVRQHTMLGLNNSYTS